MGKKSNDLVTNFRVLYPSFSSWIHILCFKNQEKRILNDLQIMQAIFGETAIFCIMYIPCHNRDYTSVWNKKTMSLPMLQFP